MLLTLTFELASMSHVLGSLLQHERARKLIFEVRRALSAIHLAGDRANSLGSLFLIPEAGLTIS
jgi:hypothetical protein